MVASFFLTETVGFAAGGIVVPGYVALTLNEPLRVAVTVVVALVTYFLLKLLSHRFLVFGRRMLLLGVLVGYLLGYITSLFPKLSIAGGRFDAGVIGYVIPGLIAYWMHRQGVIETLAVMFSAAVLTRMVVIVISGGAV